MSSRQLNENQITKNLISKKKLTEGKIPDGTQFGTENLTALEIRKAMADIGREVTPMYGGGGGVKSISFELDSKKHNGVAQVEFMRESEGNMRVTIMTETQKTYVAPDGITSFTKFVKSVLKRGKV